MSGVLPRFPDAKFVSVESGIGFIPFILEAADYAFGEAAMAKERPEFELLPSEYFHRQVYGCWFFEEPAPQRLVDKIGAGNILFETDYPHPDLPLRQRAREDRSRARRAAPRDPPRAAVGQRRRPLPRRGPDPRLTEQVLASVSAVRRGGF